MATATRTKRGFADIRCPKCGAADSLKIYVDDVSVLTCNECEDEITLDDIRDTMAAWGRLLAWLDTAPEVEGGP